VTLEKIFRPSKWFVGFCACLVAVFALLQFVVNARLEDIAKGWCKEVYTWDWPKRMHSSIKITDARVVKRGEADAIVKVQGEQTLNDDAATAGSAPVVTKCGAQLTFYKQNSEWFLGKVELQD
jgi:hypothetical protein